MAGFPDELASCTGFEWDEGNATKNWDAHRVSQAECEQAFFNRPVRIAPEVAQEGPEPRLALLGQTYQNRQLTVVFTVRGSLVRVISARPMSRQEGRLYERLTKGS
jgi:uncharacterized DUF497 family protein